LQHDVRTLIADGLWHRNGGLVQLLGLCPLLAVSNTIVNAIGLGVATLLVLTTTNVLVSLTHGWLPREIRIPVFVLLIAGAVTCVELVMNAWFHDLYRALGIFLPLIVTNCLILARAETFASRTGAVRAAIDGLAMGGGFALAIVLLGATRELVGRGSLFYEAGIKFGAAADALELQIFPGDMGFLLAMLPPGAFIALGFLVALRNWTDAQIDRRAARSRRRDPQPHVREDGSPA
jgi:electron transport complex protein RnfE